MRPGAERAEEASGAACCECYRPCRSDWRWTQRTRPMLIAVVASGAAPFAVAFASRPCRRGREPRNRDGPALPARAMAHMMRMEMALFLTRRLSCAGSRVPTGRAAVRARIQSTRRCNSANTWADSDVRGIRGRISRHSMIANASMIADSKTGSRCGSAFASLPCSLR